MTATRLIHRSSAESKTALKFWYLSLVTLMAAAPRPMTPGVFDRRTEDAGIAPAAYTLPVSAANGKVLSGVSADTGYADASGEPGRACAWSENEFLCAAAFEICGSRCLRRPSTCRKYWRSSPTDCFAQDKNPTAKIRATRPPARAKMVSTTPCGTMKATANSTNATARSSVNALPWRILPRTLIPGLSTIFQTNFNC